MMNDKFRDILFGLFKQGGTMYKDMKNSDKVIWGDGNRSRVKEVDFQKSLSDNVSSDELSEEEPKTRNIYFHDSVDSFSVQRLLMDLRHISEKEMSQTKDIWLYINSSGGDLLAGLSAMDEIANISEKISIYTVIDNKAASAATLMSIAGKKRYIKNNGFILIHELSSIMVGKYSQMKDEMRNMDMFMDKVKDAYKKYASVPEDALDEILRHDFWWDAKTALKYGLVDEIIK